MVGLEQGFARLGIESEDRQGGDERGGTSAWQSDARTPRPSGWSMLVWIAVAGAGDKIDAFAHAPPVVGHDDREALRQGRDIRSATAARQANRGTLPVSDDGGI